MHHGVGVERGTGLGYPKVAYMQGARYLCRHKHHAIYKRQETVLQMGAPDGCSECDRWPNGTYGHRESIFVRDQSHALTNGRNHAKGTLLNGAFRASKENHF